jgi:thiamine pyrophosphate-dependent acetolactate synthase large subunit-like protein
MTRAAPSAPVYVCLDVTLQEAALPDGSRDPQTALPDPSRFAAPGPLLPTDGELDKAAALLGKARRPLMLVGRHERSEPAWRARLELAERLGAAVICDQKCGVGFASDHERFVAAPAQYPDERTVRALELADAVLSLDWPDLVGLLSARKDKGRGLPTIIASPDERLHNGWSLDHFPLAEADLRFSLPADSFVQALLPRLPAKPPGPVWTPPRGHEDSAVDKGAITLAALAAAFDRVRGSRTVCLTRLPFGWPDSLTRFTGPLDCIGYDGGGGIGSTPGITVGAALALRGTGRLPVAILGDGDLLMGSQALWTAAAERLPALFLVNNNRAFHNDVEHQERIARQRGRPVENREIGMRIADPEVDLPALAKAHGLVAFPTVRTSAELESGLEQAFRAAEAGSTVLLDVLVEPPPMRR